MIMPLSVLIKEHTSTFSAFYHFMRISHTTRLHHYGFLSFYANDTHDTPSGFLPSIIFCQCHTQYTFTFLTFYHCTPISHMTHLNLFGFLLFYPNVTQNTPSSLRLFIIYMPWSTMSEISSEKNQLKR